MSLWSRVAGILALALCASPVFADEGNEPDFDFSLTASNAWGHLTGFVQVPLGGEPGTTSSRRPTLSELGIGDASTWELDGRIQWRHLFVFGGYSGLKPDGSGTLSEPLISHGISFPAGTPFQSSLKLDVGNAGVGWSFEFPEQGLSLRPKFDLALLDFAYSFASAVGTASRSYTNLAVRLGGEAEQRLGHGFALRLGGVVSLPIAQMPQLAEIDGRVSYQIPLFGSLRGQAFVGSGIRWFDFEDSQTVPNHVHVRTGALLRAGVSFAF